MPNNQSNGKLVVFEGADGSGKTTLAHNLTRYLADVGIPAQYYAFPGAERGTLGGHIYDLHHDPLSAANVRSINPTSMQLLHVAAHVEAIDLQIRPALKQGKWIILDRFWWSTLVYGLTTGVPKQSLEAMIAVEKLHWGDDLPAAVFIVQRDLPLRAEPLERWYTLVDEYTALAQKESSSAHVYSIDNNGLLNTSLAQVTTALGFYNLVSSAS